MSGFVQIFNPPYVPTPDAELARTDIARAWAGGNRGRAIIDRFLPQVCLTGYHVHLSHLLAGRRIAPLIMLRCRLINVAISTGLYMGSSLIHAQ